MTVPYYSFSLLMGQPADIPPLTSELTSALFQSLRPYNSADVGATVCPPTLVGTPASRGVASTMMIPRMVAFPTLAQVRERWQTTIPPLRILNPPAPSLGHLPVPEPGDRGGLTDDRLRLHG